MFETGQPGRSAGEARCVACPANRDASGRQATLRRLCETGYTSQVQGLVEQHQVEFLEDWNEFFGSDDR